MAKRSDTYHHMTHINDIHFYAFREKGTATFWLELSRSRLDLVGRHHADGSTAQHCHTDSVGTEARARSTKPCRFSDVGHSEPNWMPT